MRLQLESIDDSTACWTRSSLMTPDDDIHHPVVAGADAAVAAAERRLTLWETKGCRPRGALPTGGADPAAHESSDW
jgi:hypothetical protein